MLPPVAINPALRSSAPGPRAGYLATLDGWRAIAIVAVMLSHSDLTLLGPGYERRLFELGHWGVDVFFSISGLLICWRLMQEESVQGRISLRSFYIRRGFRILPAAFAFLAAIAVLGATHVIPVSVREWLSAAFFFRNYSSLFGHATVNAHFTSHFWSLAVEEHFYLLLPGLLVFAPRRLRLPLLSLLTLGIVVHRYLLLQHRSFYLVDHHTDIRLDSLLLPAILAIVAQPLENRDRLRRWLRFWPLLGVLALVVLPIGNGSFWNSTVEVVLLSAMVLGSVLNPGNFVGRLLETAPLRFVGRISYGLYLWQELFFFTGDPVIGRPLGALERFPLQALATFGIALASYYWLEIPAIRLGHRFATSPVPGRQGAVEP